MKAGVTQVDIARKLGISQSAVGSVVGSYSSRSARIQLRPEMRKRVLETATQMGYRPHRHAQLMRRHKTGVIGIIQTRGLLNVATLRGLYAAQAVHDAGYQILSGDVLWYIEGLRVVVDAMLDARVEGVLLIGPDPTFSPEELKRFARAKIPVVSVAGAWFPGIPQVRCDVRQGFSALTQHLLSIGHRRLVLLTYGVPREADASAFLPDEERVTGFQEAVKNFVAANPGVSVTSETVRMELSGEWTRQGEPGKRGMREVLQRSQRPDVVLCSNDHWAQGALAACAEAGLRVPEDVALTGFDNETFGEFGAVPLTTVEQPTKAMVGKATEMLVRLVRGEKLPEGESAIVKVLPELVIRKSCGATCRQDSPQIQVATKQGETQ